MIMADPKLRRIVETEASKPPEQRTLLRPPAPMAQDATRVGTTPARPEPPRFRDPGRMPVDAARAPDGTRASRGVPGAAQAMDFASKAFSGGNMGVLPPTSEPEGPTIGAAPRSLTRLALDALPESVAAPLSAAARALRPAPGPYSGVPGAVGQFLLDPTNLMGDGPVGGAAKATSVGLRLGKRAPAKAANGSAAAQSPRKAWYHGTQENINTLDNTIDGPTFFSSNIKDARFHAGRGGGPGQVLEADLRMKNPLVVDVPKPLRGVDPTEYWDNLEPELWNRMIDGGHDGVVVRGSKKFGDIAVTANGSVIQSSRPAGAPAKRVVDAAEGVPAIRAALAGGTASDNVANMVRGGETVPHRSLPFNPMEPSTWPADYARENQALLRRRDAGEIDYEQWKTGGRELLDKYRVDTPFVAAQNERVTRAAIRAEDGSVTTGAWHGGILDDLPADAGRTTDGFVTDRGQFLDRGQSASLTEFRAGRSLGLPEEGLHSYHIGMDGNPVSDPRQSIRWQGGGGAGDNVGSTLGAPNIQTREPWKPTERGVFDRSVPDNQGTVPSDPRYTPWTTDRQGLSPLVEAIAGSRTVRKGLDADVERGLLMGGPVWYNTAPVNASLMGIPGAISPRDFHLIGGASSASNSVPNEFSVASLINFAQKRGMSREEVVQEFLRHTGWPNRPSFMDMHYDLGMKAVREGVYLPKDLSKEKWKIPSYADKRLGGGGLLDVNAPGGMPALDTHERRRIMQLVQENPRLERLARQTGALEQARKDSGRLPLRNAKDYQAVSSLYTQGAQRYGLPTAGAYQAPRWQGGGHLTGLRSEAVGDFTQLLENSIFDSARLRGMGTDPKSLRDYWAKVARGDEFLLPLGY
jgi:hypothetical protein